MKTPETSVLFEKRINEASGVEYYVLTKKVATYQQSFYFSNNSMTNDGRFLWFYCSFPPVFNASTRQLGVVDFETDEIHLFNDTLFSGASPYVDPETGDVYFTWGNQLLKRSPYKDAHTIELARVKTKGKMMRMSTHLTSTPDKKEFLLDIHEGVNSFYTGTINIETGEHINVHESNPWHAFASKDESYYVYDEVIYDKYDEWYRGCPSKLKFYDAKTDKLIEIVSYMPSNEFTPQNQCEYHIDPHPRITENEKYIVFTTSELGGADIGIVNVEQLLKKTR